MAASIPQIVDIDTLRKELEAQTPQTYKWTYSNGRRYASTEQGHYYMPADEPEITRLNDQHFLLTDVKYGALHHCPLPKDRDLKILDIGCGTGIWCLQVADAYPRAKVWGMDIAPIQPKEEGRSVEWVLLDFEEADWPFAEESFDLIHLSLVHGCVKDWSAMMAKIVRYVAPGGYVEHQEFSMGLQYSLSLMGEVETPPADPEDLRPYFRWARGLVEAAEKRGRTLQLGPKLQGFQEAAGLEDVNDTVCPMTCGTWASNAAERLLGARLLLQTLNGIEGYTTVLFTKALGWDAEVVKQFIERVKEDLKDDGLRKVIDFHVCYGRKPET